MTDEQPGVAFDDARWREVADHAARIYEEVLVPAVFEPWVPQMLAAAGVGAGDDVLDVACGTGVVARAAAGVAGPGGSVTGLDLTPSMLEVASAIEPNVDWRLGDATDLPFDEETFDAVVCQAGLMFFPDRVRAIAEMHRVLRTRGRAAILVWAESEGQEAYARLLEREVSAGAGERYRAPWAMGRADELRRVVLNGGFADVSVETRPGASRFRSLREFLESTRLLLAGEAEPGDLLAPARESLAQYVAPDGSIMIPGPAHVAVASKG